MDRGLVTLIGMSIAYVASFIGMGLAWWAWRRRNDEQAPRTGGRQPGRSGNHVGGREPVSRPAERKSDGGQA